MNNPVLQKCLIIGVVGGDGKKMPPYFFDKKPFGKGIDQEEYIKVLEEVVWPWIHSNYEQENIAYIWQQV